MNNNDYNNFFGFSPYSNSNNSYDNNVDFNPITQYEQGYIYYRYLTQQLEYKIKCKEYEKLCSENNRNERRVS